MNNLVFAVKCGNESYFFETQLYMHLRAEKVSDVANWNSVKLSTIV